MYNRNGFGRPLSMVDNRYTLRRSLAYHTKRNRTKPVRTPGNRLVAHYIPKRCKPAHCAETGKPLNGIPQLRTAQLRRLKRSRRSVSRAYGGVYCGAYVKERIIQAFMYEEEQEARSKDQDKGRKGR